MRVPANHLARDYVDYIGKIEAPHLGCHLRVIDHLQQKIPELFLEPIEIIARDRIDNLIGFLDGVGGDGGEALLDVPRTARVFVAQARHDGEKIVERVALLRFVRHRV